MVAGLGHQYPVRHPVQQEQVMRNLVIERITELWIEESHPFEFDITVDRLEELSNRELLDMLEDIVAFAG